jgi:molecular chaperone HscB
MAEEGSMNYFEVFGLPRRLEINGAELRRRFYELSRLHHPDFHHGAAAEEQAAALDASARLNAAYRALRDPLARIEYLVRLEEGGETHEGAVVTPKAPPELLAEMFEIQEALAEARVGRGSGRLDDAMREMLRGQRERLLERHRDEEAQLTGPLSRAWDAAEGAGRASVLEAFKQSLATRAYLRTVIVDLGEALGEDQGEHVAHHRH